MNTADFLFPRDLEVTASGIKKVLVIGSCLSELFVKVFKESKPGVSFDYVLFNYASDLPEKTIEEIGEYDFQYVQLPLRSVLTDAVVRVFDGDSSDALLGWIAKGKHNIDLMLASAMKYSESASLLSFVSNFVVPQGRASASLAEQDSETDLIRVVRELNTYLASVIHKYPHCFLADVDVIANSLGKRFFLDDILYFYTHGSVFFDDWAGQERYPHWTAPDPGRIEVLSDLGLTYENRNSEFFDAVYRQMDAMYRTINQIDAVKVVIFDLDNTLWRGQLVEHYQPDMQWPYSHGWPLGIWEAIHYLRKRGVAVTIASKNDENLVKAKWSNAVDPPFIKYEDFIAPKINWMDKPTNIASILDSLGVTAGSALFIDDNPIERASTCAMLPGIRTLGADPFVLRRILLWAPELQIAIRTNESARREDMLKSQVIRNREKSTMSRAQFLESLGTCATITRIRDSTHSLFGRIFELVNKTNQFNTSGQRWGLEDYRKHFNNGGEIFVFSVTDKFVEYGTVGVVFLLENRILQFVMSCRVLGMGIEIAVLGAMIPLIRAVKPSMSICATILRTEANTPSQDVYERAGFRREDENRFVLLPADAVASAGNVRVDITHG